MAAIKVLWSGTVKQLHVGVSSHFVRCDHGTPRMDALQVDRGDVRQPGRWLRIAGGRNGLVL